MLIKYLNVLQLLKKIMGFTWVRKIYNRIAVSKSILKLSFDSIHWIIRFIA
jgi:hypothetical protein